MSDRPLTLPDYAQSYAAGRTPEAAVADTYRRIAAHGDPAIFITLRPQAELLAEAAALDRPDGRPLWGIPVAVKDNIDVAGLPTTCACPDYACRPSEDAEVVRRLRAAGALILGKTNLDQFATGLVGVRSPYGAPRNTFDPALVPGGSSSGSAVAVAAGLVPLALGSDTAGSGRVPAALNNIVGLKPTLGAVSTRGIVPACRTLDCVSVFALTVADAWTAYRAIAGYDAADPFSRPASPGSPPPLPDGLRIGVPDAESRRFGSDPLAEAAFDAALDDVDALGATLVPVDLSPFFAVAALLYDGPWVAERWEAIRPFIETRPEALHPVTRAITEKACLFSAADAFAGRYRLAELRRAIEPVLGGLGALALPSLPRPRSLDDLQADPIGPNAELGTYTNFVNLLDLCALAVPGRFRADSLPAGITLVGPAGTDAALAAIGSAVHARAGVPLGATGVAQRPPAAWPAAATPPDEIELVVVGAHLTGLALNGELREAGGRFRRAVETAPEYRFYALSGPGPRRPGLLRVGSGGHAIRAEVWALPPTGFARFVAAIPAPLGIGTVRLEDGTAPKGFLCEAEGVRGAQDISAFGGWRAFLEAEAQPRAR